tara:strand:- start:1431 stop:1640 length:210 start_codon:yes stop_codon:yes gene_type:complete
MTQQEAQLEITMEDLNQLWAMNPLAQSQFSNILQAKRIKELEGQLGGSNNGHDSNITSIDSFSEDSEGE